MKRIALDGRVESGVVELPFEPAAALRFLEKRAQAVLSLKRLPDWLTGPARLLLRGPSISDRVLADALDSLGLMTGSGATLAQALAEIAKSPDPGLQRIAGFILADVEAGESFAEAVERQGRRFPTSVRAACRVGERSGRLPEALRNAARTIKLLDDLKRKGRGAVLYPAFLALVAFSAAAFWFTSVTPEIMGLFADLRIKPPALTLALTRTAAWIGDHAGLLLAVPAATGLLLAALRSRFDRAALPIDRAARALPFFGPLVRAKNAALFAENLSLLLSAGVDAPTAFEAAQAGVGNRAFAAAIRRAVALLESGRTPAQALSQAGALPADALVMLAVGEKSSSLAEQAGKAAALLTERLTRRVERATAVLEPALILVLGVLFAAAATGLFLPLYSVLGAIGG